MFVLARTASIIDPRGGRRVGWRELDRTVSSFRFFRLANLLLGASDRRAGLAETIDLLHRRDLYAGLWAVEGVGFRCAERYGPQAGLLSATVTGELSGGTLLPLHVGAGLELARRGLSEERLAGGVGEAVERLLRGIEESSTQGCVGVGTEAIGLHVRTLLANRLLEVDDAMRAHGRAVRAWFWHGVGRALYFLFPRAIYGESDAVGWGRVSAEAPDREVLRPLQAGFVWALSLVNTGEPQVIESFLERHGAELDQDVLEHGVVGTTLLWHAWAGVDGRLQRLLDYQPEHGKLTWNDRVRRPLERGLEDVAPILAEGREFERLFLYPFQMGRP
jgi:hypothetical protein